MYINWKSDSNVGHKNVSFSVEIDWVEKIGE